MFCLYKGSDTVVVSQQVGELFPCQVDIRFYLSASGCEMIIHPLPMPVLPAFGIKSRLVVTYLSKSLLDKNTFHHITFTQWLDGIAAALFFGKNNGEGFGYRYGGLRFTAAAYSILVLSQFGSSIVGIFFDVLPGTPYPAILFHIHPLKPRFAPVICCFASGLCSGTYYCINGSCRQAAQGKRNRFPFSRITFICKEACRISPNLSKPLNTLQHQHLVQQVANAITPAVPHAMILMVAAAFLWLKYLLRVVKYMGGSWWWFMDNGSWMMVHGLTNTCVILPWSMNY